jgi:hypothetical protein
MASPLIEKGQAPAGTQAGGRFLIRPNGLLPREQNGASHGADKLIILKPWLPPVLIRRDFAEKKVGRDV